MRLNPRSRGTWPIRKDDNDRRDVQVSIRVRAERGPLANNSNQIQATIGLNPRSRGTWPISLLGWLGLEDRVSIRVRAERGPLVPTVTVGGVEVSQSAFARNVAH